MKKSIKLIGLLLAASTALSMASCKKATNTSTRTTRDSSKESTTTDPSEETTTTEEPVSTTSKETTTEQTSESTADSTTETSTGEPQKLNLKIDVPEKGCPIEFPTDERYHYVMNLSLDTTKHTIGGHVQVTFFNNSDDEWDRLCLRDYSSLFIDAKTAGYDGAIDTHGATTEIKNIVDERSGKTMDLSRDNDVSVVWIPLDTKLAPKEEMTLSYDFIATIPTVADRYGVQDGVFNVTNFYPILAVYTEDGWSHEAFYNLGECFFSEIADFDVTLLVPEKITVLSTGVTTDVQHASGNGLKAITINAPCVRDFVFCACEDFIVSEEDHDGVHIRVAYRGGEKSDYAKMLAEKSMTSAKQSLDAFGDAFGKYPYKSLEVVLAPIDAGGMEYPNLVIIECNEPLGIDAEHFDSYAAYMANFVVSHEIGHQWFMGIVGSNSGMEPWLDESFASFTECVFVMAYFSADDQRMHLPSKTYCDLKSLVQQGRLKGIIPINRSYYEFTTSDYYLDAVYSIGQYALYQIGEIIGMDELYGVIREYVHRNAFTNSTEDRFFEVLYECVGTDNEEVNSLIKDIFHRDPPTA